MYIIFIIEKHYFGDITWFWSTKSERDYRFIDASKTTATFFTRQLSDGNIEIWCATSSYQVNLSAIHLFRVREDRGIFSWYYGIWKGFLVLSYATPIKSMLAWRGVCAQSQRWWCATKRSKTTPKPWVSLSLFLCPCLWEKERIEMKLCARLHIRDERMKLFLWANRWLLATKINAHSVFSYSDISLWNRSSIK